MSRKTIGDMQAQQQLDLNAPAKTAGPVECLGVTFADEEGRRAYFMDRLREKLEDPEFRKTPGFPKGDVEDILRLSDPPYYTACPNPFLGDVARHRSQRHEVEPAYSRKPFAVDTAGGKNDPIYNAHAYHTKSPWTVIAEYVKHFTEPGDLILDAFAGAGMSGVAVRSVGEGRDVILSELSPIATFISSRNVAHRDVTASHQRANRILKTMRERHGWMFRTAHTGWDASIRDHRGRANGTAKGEGLVQFTLWSDICRCQSCAKEYVYWHAAVDFDKGGLKSEYPCPACNAETSKSKSEQVLETVFDSVLQRPRSRVKQTPVLINYKVGSKRFEKFPDEEDLRIVAQVESLAPGPGVPDAPMMFLEPPWGEMYRAGYHAGMTHAHHFYWHRALLVLADVFEALKDDQELLYWFTSTLAWCNKENRLSVGNYFKKKGGVITTYRGAIYIASLGIETNPIERLRLRIKSALIDTPPADANAFITTQSSSSLGLPDESVDYVFIDPPFGNNLIYSELNFLWESWLRVWTNNDPEIIISKYQKKTLLDYTAGLRHALAEIYRVLRPGRWITVQFHNSQNSVWNAIQTALFESGCIVADVRTMDKGKSSFKQVVAAGSVKKDLVISAYKPASELETQAKLEGGTEGLVWSFMRSHLAQLPTWVGNNGTDAEVIVERQAHVLFDRMVAYHIQRSIGVPISAAEFYSGLAQRFPERDQMYFLPEQVAEYDRRRTTVAELRQLSLFVTDEASAIQWLRQQLHKRPQTFQELHPQFMRELQSWAKHERAIELREMLEQNFIQYGGAGPVPSQIHAYLSTNFKELRNREKEDGELRSKAKDRWYVPDPGKQGDLEKLREKALLREFDDYKASTQRKLKQFRTEALRVGFKASYDAQDYRCIVDVAKKIPETVLQEDEKLLMYYDVASMRLGEE